MFKVECIGNLGADAAVRESSGGKFISFRIAHSEKWTDGNGHETERTQWIDVVMNNAESAVLPYLKQGIKVFVRGHAMLRVFSSQKERKIVAGIQVNATEVELCGGTYDDVPREVINPDTSEVYKVTKLYWTADGWKGMKKDDTKQLIDKRGLSFKMDYHGFIIPDQSDAQDSQTPVDEQQ